MLLLSTTFLLLLVVSSSYCQAVLPNIESLSLNGTWNVVNGNGSISIPGSVPGGIYTDLQNAGLLGDIFYRYNDEEYRWVARESWTYSRTFVAATDILNKTRIQIIFEGLDTAALVSVNGHPLGVSENMFIRYVYDLKGILKEGQNNISVVFEAPLNYSDRRYEEQLEEYLVPPECVPDVYRGECHVNHIRKMQASYSWDWGPAFPSVGIWKNVYIEAYDHFALRDIQVWAVKETDRWDFHVRTIYDAALYTPVDIDLLIVIEDMPRYVVRVETLTPDSTRSAELNVSLPLFTDDFVPELWWPRTHGEQKLYNIMVSCNVRGSSEAAGKVVKFGFRTIEVVEDDVSDENGTLLGSTFYFRINGIPIFMKGSNWIPAHILPEQATPSLYRYLLTSARDANMNMLRVWGGGIYEKDEFYDICDELGILLWHDLMFASSMYPVSDWFLKTSAEEVKHQIRRLQRRTSIAVWAANNENEDALVGNAFGTADNFELYKADYIHLYINTIRPIALQEDSSRVFLPSSPSNGKLTEQVGWVNEVPGDPSRGDKHYYNYMDDGWKWQTYPISRFTSESGIQSYPSLEAMSSISEPEDLVLGSEFLQRRQHHPNGDSEMAHQIESHFAPYNSFRDVIMQTQINQAMSMKTEIELLRRWRDEVNEEGLGRSMGALVWQLNDIWQAASWGSIEYGGKWKMAHYFYRRAFDSIAAVCIESTPDFFEFFSISDQQIELTFMTLVVQLNSWADGTAQKELEFPYFQQSSDTVLKVGNASLDYLLENTTCDRASCFLTFKIFNINSEGYSQDNFHLFTTDFKNTTGLVKPTFTIENITDTSDSLPEDSIFTSMIQFALTTDQVSPFVWLDVSGFRGRFSDNGMLMLPSSATLQFLSLEIVSVEDFEAAVSVISLTDLYSETNEGNYVT